MDEVSDKDKTIPGAKNIVTSSLSQNNNRDVSLRKV